MIINFGNVFFIPKYGTYTIILLNMKNYYDNIYCASLINSNLKENCTHELSKRTFSNDIIEFCVCNSIAECVFAQFIIDFQFCS